MQKILFVFLLITSFAVQASSLKPCEPYKKDSYGNLHISYSKDKGEDAKLKTCLATLKGFRVGVYFEHPLALSHIYTPRLQDQKFQLYNVDSDTKIVTWLWRNGRQIPDHWTTETAVRVIVKNKEGKLLLVKDKSIPQLLVPGGGVNKGELVRDAAVRKLSQEVGIATLANNLKLIGFLNRTNVYGHKGLNEVVYIFVLEDYAGDATTSPDIEKLYWVTPAEVKQGKVDGIKIHPFASPLVGQAMEDTAKKGYARMSDLTDHKMTAQSMIDVEFIN